MLAVDGGIPVRRELIPFCKVVIGDEEIAEVIDSLKSGWIVKGPKVSRFEQELAKFCSAKHVVAVSSCTAALHLSLLVNGVGPGDVVLVPAITFVATANAVEHCGARPVFVDIDAETFNISPDSILDALWRYRGKVKAIVPVHLYGLPCNMDWILEIAEYYGLVVVEDAAHALGAEYLQQPIGSLGTLACFSFYPTKNVASPDGGAIAFQDGKYEEELKLLSHHGIDKDAWQRFRDLSAGEALALRAGFKYNWNDLAASVALAQLRKYPKMLQRRKAIAKRFLDVLSEFDGVQTQPGVRGHAWHLFTFVLDAEVYPVSNAQVVRALQAEGLGAAIRYEPLHTQPYFAQKYNLMPCDCPVADRMDQRLVTISPTPCLTDGEVDDSCEILGKVLRAYHR